MATDSSPAKVARWLSSSKFTVAFTGAGISTESGIPDFRSPGGVWSKYRQVMFDEFLQSADARHEYWRQKCEAHKQFAAARPNRGHQTLACWEQQGVLHGVITQNIDGLHQQAGSSRVLELHGTAREVECLDCGRRFDPEPLVNYFLSHNAVPDCANCGGRLKHTTVSFGQRLPEDVLQEAIAWAQQCELMLAIGSSLVVYPAAQIPYLAWQGGARLVIINRDPTPLDEKADVLFRASCGEVLRQINEALSRRRNG